MDRRKMLEDFLAQNPTDSFARYGLALDYANSGETERATQELQRLTEINPDYTAGYQMWAQILMKLGKTSEARPLLEKGIACAQRTGNAHAAREMQGMLEELEILDS
jgi:Tfp pilus assembly protein PilF